MNINIAQSVLSERSKGITHKGLTLTTLSLLLAALAACSGGGSLPDISATVQAGLGSGDSVHTDVPNPLSGPLSNLGQFDRVPTPYAMGGWMIDPSRFRNAPNLWDLLNEYSEKYGTFWRVVKSFDETGMQPLELPWIYIGEQGETSQRMFLYKAIEAARQNDMTVILDWGSSDRVSALEACASFEHSLCVGLDWITSPSYSYPPLAQEQIPSVDSGSFVISARLDATDLSPSLVKADRIHIFGPDPLQTTEHIEKASFMLKPGGELIVVFAPDYLDGYPKDLGLSSIHKDQFDAEVINLTVEQIGSRTGTMASRYLPPKDSNRLVPTLIVTRK